MANMTVSDIRNIALVAHGGAGKTTLAEAMLFDSGAVDRLGRVEDGNTTTDFEPEEIQKKMSITTSLAFCMWKDKKINIIDTPGFNNLLEDARGAMKAADAAVFLVSALSGVKGETEKLWKFADEFNLPRMVFVNEMDKEASDFFQSVEGISKVLGVDAVPLQVPLGAAEAFSGVADLVAMKAYAFGGGKPSVGEIPADAAEAAEKYRKILVEKVAEADDSLLERYLEGGELTEDEIRSGVRQGALRRSFVPVLCGSASKNIGVQPLLDLIVQCMPSPVEAAAANPMKGTNPKDGSAVERKPDEKEPFSAYVFKTIADPFAGKLSLFRVCSGALGADSSVLNPTSDTKERIGQVFFLQGKKQVPAQKLGPGELGVVTKLKGTGTGDTLCDPASPVVFERVKFAEPIISYAIEPKSKGDEDKVSTGLQRMLDEDPTVRFHRDEEAKEMLLSGMGQAHLEITLERLKRKFGIEVVMKSPKIPYRETITVAAKAQGKYKKQSGGRGQYGDCHIAVEPLPRGSGYEFVDNIVGGAIPRSYIPAVDKGIQDAMREGIYAGFPMVDVRVSLYDGSYHAVDSSEMAFKIAGSMGIKKAVEIARPVVLEPVMKAVITTPDEYLGAVIGDLNGRRGKVQGMEQAEGSANQQITALVPMAEMLTYANILHSITAGRATYHMEFSHYDEMPAHLAQKLLEEREKAEDK